MLPPSLLQVCDAAFPKTEQQQVCAVMTQHCAVLYVMFAYLAGRSPCTQLARGCFAGDGVLS
jgi:hypothetical protein